MWMLLTGSGLLFDSLLLGIIVNDKRRTLSVDVLNAADCVATDCPNLVGEGRSVTFLLIWNRVRGSQTSQTVCRKPIFRGRDADGLRHLRFTKCLKNWTFSIHGKTIVTKKNYHYILSWLVKINIIIMQYLRPTLLKIGSYL